MKGVLRAAALLLVTWALARSARADGIRILIDARVTADHRAITGFLALDSPKRVFFVDPLAELPDATDDVFGPRTWPGAHDPGVVHFEEVDDGVWWFYTILPKRYGDVGSTAHGLFANGAWYPQPLVSGLPPEVQWVVQLRASEGDDALLVVGDELGDGVVRWRGAGERVSIAVVPHAKVTPIVAEGVRVEVVSQGRPTNALMRELREALPVARPHGTPLDGVIVVAPLRRRLARPGRGMSYISDRAFRVTPGFRRFHRVAVARGAVQGLLPLADPYERELTAASAAMQYAERLAGPGARDIARWAAWLPRIDALIYDGRLPYFAEVFETAWPGDPVQDDLMERYAPHTPGTAVLAQVADAWGAQTADALGVALASGAPLLVAAEVAGVPPAWLEGHRGPSPPSALSLSVDSGSVGVGRVADVGTPAEVIVIDVDGERTAWVTAPGTDGTVVPVSAPPRRVVVDPDGHLDPTSRAGLTWPGAYTVTAAAWVDTLSVSDLYVEGTAAMWVRRRHDTHNTVAGTVFTDQESLLGASLGYIRRDGPLLDGLTRPHRVSVWASPALLNPAYAPVDDGGRVAVGGGLAYAWDTRVSREFPVRGHRLTASVDGGFVPGTARTWLSTGASATGVASPHPRHPFVADVSGAIARGDVDHRLLPLGGPVALRSLPTGTAIGTRRAIGLAEYRVAPIRGASVPALLAWGTELQLSVGGEVGTGTVDGAAVSAAGVTAGLGVVGDVFGMQPQLMGITAAWPVWADGLDVVPDAIPELYLRFWQPF